MELAEGLRVIEVGGRPSGRVAGSLLASMGADVTRVVVKSSSGSGMDAVADPAAVALDHGKRTVAVDAAELPAWLESELPRSDVLVTSGENRHEGESSLARRANVPYAGVHVDITPYGSTGPYRRYAGTDLTVTSFAGVGVYVGKAEREPLVPPFDISGHQAGLVAVIAAFAGLRQLELARAGESVEHEPAAGLVVDIAEYEALATTHMVGLYPLAMYSGDIPRRAGHRKPAPYPFTLLRCQDGAVCLTMIDGRHWKTLTSVMGQPAWTRDPRFQNRRVMGELYADEVDALVEEWLAGCTKEQLRLIAKQHRIPLGPVHTVQDLLRYEQFLERGFYREVALDPDRTVLAPGLPFRTEVSPFHTPASAAATAVTTVSNGAARGRPGPLAGVRVLDLGWVVSGPTVGGFLADLGADVVKVESVTHLDASRRGLPLIPVDVDAGDAGLLPNLMPHFNAVNRGKRSAVLNLKTPEGRQLLLRLAAQADVLVENFGAGGLEKLGIGPADLWAVRPNLVIARISLLGQTGPDRDLIGYASQSTALGGLDAVTGYAGEAPVGLIALNFGDVNAAQFAVMGVLAAIRNRIGCVIDVSMGEANAWHLGSQFVEHQLTGAVPGPVGHEHPDYIPHGLYRCESDADSWVSIAVRDADEWAALCSVIKDSRLDPTMHTVDDRRNASRAIDEAIASWAAARTAQQAVEELQAVGVPAAAALGAEGLLFDPHCRSRQTVVDVAHRTIGVVPTYGSPVRTEPPMMFPRGQAPDLGEHTLDVILEAGLARHAIPQYSAAGAFDKLDLKA